MFQKAIIVLLLLITPFAQARAVLICSMMNGQIVEECCCPGHAEHGAPARHDTPEAACCEVAVLINEKAFSAAGTEQPTLKRVHDIPVIPAPAALSPMLPTFAVAMRPLPPDDVPNLTADRLYLRTARLRL